MFALFLRTSITIPPTNYIVNTFFKSFSVFFNITLLVLDVMIYFCNDAINIYNNSTRVKAKSVVKTRTYTYQDKIAK